MKTRRQEDEKTRRLSTDGLEGEASYFFSITNQRVINRNL